MEPVLRDTDICQRKSKGVQHLREHICDNHDGCHESWCYNKRAILVNKTYHAPKDHRINKGKEGPAYEQLRKVFDQYANLVQMAYCNHPFDTQTNEALNQSIAIVAPKSICYSSTTSLNSRIALVIGIHNMGHLPFFMLYFHTVGVDMGPTLTSFLSKKHSRKLRKRNYQKKISTKVKRSKQHQKQREEVFQDRTDKSYGTGVGLTAGMSKKREVEGDIAGGQGCKCGSTTHKRTTHRDCPLRKEVVRKTSTTTTTNPPASTAPLPPSTSSNPPATPAPLPSDMPTITLTNPPPRRKPAVTFTPTTSLTNTPALFPSYPALQVIRFVTYVSLTHE
jgi:hypothetical protein